MKRPPRAVLILLAVSACAVETPDVESTTSFFTGNDTCMDCTSNADCASGVCEGEGCTADAPGTCKPKDRMCTRDARSYCGRDGKPFIGSGSCPGARFQDPSACEGQPSPI